MEAESSPFESSEMLATFLASTPFLKESWTLCSLANSTAPRSFVADQRGEVGYLAFSGVQVSDGSQPSCGTLMALDECGWEHPFSPLRCDGDGEGTVKVDAGFLRLFLEFYQRPDFQNQIREFQGRVKMIILTGHSFGATTATLTALWLLSQGPLMASPIFVLCLTFGTPLLGNESLSRAIHQRGWGKSFCNIVSKLDVVPKLFFAPLTSLTPQLPLVLHFWQVAMASPNSEQLVNSERLVGELGKQNLNEFFSNVLKCVRDAAYSKKQAGENLFWPFGSYLFCSKEGAICLDNATSVVKMMHLMLKEVSPASMFEDHLRYGDYTKLLAFQFPKRTNINDLSESSYKAGVLLALQSSGIDLQMARQVGRAPNLNNAYLAIKRSEIKPCLVELGTFKTFCDDFCDRCGYYDTFKESAASGGESKIKNKLFRLGTFWDEVIGMAAHSFHPTSNWIDASHSYMLLTEPLEIAYYYGRGMHMEKGHYIEHGRSMRFQSLERWWNRKVAVAAQEPRQNNNKKSGSEYASLTQDSLFWARVEEAKDWLKNAEEEEDLNKLGSLLENMNRFETYAEELIKNKEVSIDVLAKKSSYTLWAEKWEDLKPKLSQRASAVNVMDCDYEEIKDNDTDRP